MSALGLLFAVSAEALALAFGHLSNGLNYYRSGRQDMALREFSVVLTDYRDTPAADDALYWTAMAQQARGDKQKADTTLGELAVLFPNSPYLSVTGTAAPAAPVAPAPAGATATSHRPPPVVEPPKPTAPAAPASPVPAATTSTALVQIRVRDNATAIELNGIPFRSASEFEAALADLKRSRPELTVVLRQDPGVDLQMVIDAMNIFEKLQVNMRTR
jgi:biopolymer transport protein ExbD